MSSLDGWEMKLLETTPCFIISDLAHSIQRSELKGYKLAEVETSITEEFEELYPGKVLPQFRRRSGVKKREKQFCFT